MSFLIACATGLCGGTSTAYGFKSIKDGFNSYSNGFQKSGMFNTAWGALMVVAGATTGLGVPVSNLISPEKPAVVTSQAASIYQPR